MRNKTVFIGHPIKGDVQKNIERILEICKKVHAEGIVPVASYLVSLQYLSDETVEDGKVGMEENREYFRRKYIDELWLFGDRISSEMKEEILLAKEMEIPIIPKTEGTKKDLEKLFGSID